MATERTFSILKPDATAVERPLGMDLVELLGLGVRHADAALGDDAQARLTVG
jgi:nucleoside diphosphate kinase